MVVVVLVVVVIVAVGIMVASVVVVLYACLLNDADITCTEMYKYVYT